MRLLPLLMMVPALGWAQGSETLKALDDLAWQNEFSGTAQVEKFTYTGQPPARERNATAQGAGNPMVLYGYLFRPQGTAKARSVPLVVFVHEGVHSNFMTRGRANCLAVVRELLDRGYAVVAPEYRGSTGHGEEYSDAIDYGGEEVTDVIAARQWALDAYPELDPKRVGIIGWSHGGFITLMNAFQHAEGYRCAYAGVPVSDLVARMGYKNDSYRKIFSQMLGKDAEADVKEYERRSPYRYAGKLTIPLLVHGNSNDEDVNVLEVRHLLAELKAAGVKFESRIFEDAPGGHYFNRLDSPAARESRAQIYKFLDRYLKP